MTTDNNWVTRVETDNNLIARLVNVKDGLLDGLHGIELPSGWPDTYLTETTTSIWTSAAILQALVAQRIYPPNMNSVVSRILLEKKQIDGFVGWTMEKRFAPVVSTYVTADVLSLFLLLHNCADVDDVIVSLQKMQNDDGGWGVCPKDTISKVTSTVWALDALLNAYVHPFTRKHIEERILQNAIKWLYSAQNDISGDYGWGFLPDAFPSSVSATSVALSVLLKANQIDSKFNIKSESVRRGIDTLLSLGNNGFWKGDIEDFGITVDGKFLARHTTGGLGTLAVLNTLLLAVQTGYLPPDSEYLYLGLSNLLERSRPYPGYKGLWLIPSDQAGPPMIWNSAYAVGAISSVLDFYLYLRRRHYIETDVYNQIYRKVKFWKRVAIALIVAIGGVSISLYLARIGLITWFSNLNPLLQGLILIVFTIAIEEAYQRIKRFLLRKMNRGSRD